MSYAASITSPIALPSILLSLALITSPIALPRILLPLALITYPTTPLQILLSLASSTSPITPLEILLPVVMMLSPIALLGDGRRHTESILSRDLLLCLQVWEIPLRLMLWECVLLCSQSVE